MKQVGIGRDDINLVISCWYPKTTGTEHTVPMPNPIITYRRMGEFIKEYFEI